MTESQIVLLIYTFNVIRTVVEYNNSLLVRASNLLDP